jgi:hypothetical protein
VSIVGPGEITILSSAVVHAGDPPWNGMSINCKYADGNASTPGELATCLAVAFPAADNDLPACLKARPA